MKSSCEKAIFALWLLFAAAVSPAQTFTNLLDFNFTDGAAPESTLIQATDGNLYGYTTGGGLNVCAGSCGTLFKIDHQGKLTTFYEFCSGGKLPCLDGMTPNGALIQASDGNFYGNDDRRRRLWPGHRVPGHHGRCRGSPVFLQWMLFQRPQWRSNLWN